MLSKSPSRNILGPDVPDTAKPMRWLEFSGVPVIQNGNARYRDIGPIACFSCYLHSHSSDYAIYQLTLYVVEHYIFLFGIIFGILENFKFRLVCGQ